MSDGVSKVRNNFNRVARDLDRAVSLARFGPLEMYLWTRARELCWSLKSKEPVPFVIGFTAEAKVTGWDRGNLSAAFKRMVRNNIFVETDDGKFLINKDFRTWIGPKGEPRLTPEQVELCMRVASKEAIRVMITRTGFNDSCDGSHADFNDSCDGSHAHTNRSARGDELNTEKEITLVPVCGVNSPAYAHTHAGPSSRQSEEPERPAIFALPTPIRQPEDAAKLAEAEQLLASDLRTEHVAMELGRRRNLPELAATPGWKFLTAARKLLDPGLSDGKRQSFAYFLAIVRGLTDGDRDDAPKLTPYQRRYQAKLDAFRRHHAAKEGPKDGA